MTRRLCALKASTLSVPKAPLKLPLVSLKLAGNKVSQQCEHHTAALAVFPFQLGGSAVSALCLQAALIPSVTSCPLYLLEPGGDPSGKAGVRQLPGILPGLPCVGQCCNRELPEVIVPQLCGPPSGHYREKGRQVFPSVDTSPKVCT